MIHTARWVDGGRLTQSYTDRIGDIKNFCLLSAASGQES